MVSVNLLPSSTILTRKRARRLRCWLLVVAFVAGISGIPATIDLVNTARAAALERQITPVLAELTTTQDNLRNAQARYDDLSAWIAQADALRTKRSWAGLLLALIQRMPEEVWLVNLETIGVSNDSSAPPSSAPRNGSSRAGAEADGPVAVLLEGPTGIRVTGYALDHDWLYEFMSRLKAADVFTSVELIQAAREPVLRAQAVRFVLECTW